MKLTNKKNALNSLHQSDTTLCAKVLAYRRKGNLDISQPKFN